MSEIIERTDTGENPTSEVPAGKKSEKTSGKGKKLLIAALLLAAACAAGFFSFSGWVKLPWMEEKRLLEHGHIVKESWIQEGEDFFYLDREGKLVTGLQEIDGSYYFFSRETGAMQTGWKKIGNGASGTGKYFFDASGKAVTGWMEIVGDAEYWFNEKGEMQTGWLEVDGNKYYLDSEGRKCTGWKRIDGRAYYLDEDGVLQTGWIEAGGERFLLDENGNRRTGRCTIDGKEYYFTAEGVLQTGWVQRDGDRYFYDKDGVLQTGLSKIDGDWYYFSEKGTVDPGWHDTKEIPQQEDDQLGKILEAGRFYVCGDGYILNPEDKTGSYGRLVVRSAGIDVCLYGGVSRDDYQSVVDAENSAIVVKERRDIEPVIADRRSQGFILSDIEEGSSAVLISADGTLQEYMCVRKTNGVNVGDDVVDSEGFSVWQQNEGGICAYSGAGLADNREMLDIVFWQPVTEDAETEETAGQE